MQPRPVHALLLAGATAFSITLVVLLWTRWGHSRSLEKCVLLSFLAHALLTGYAATVQIVSFRPAPREQFVRIALVDGPPGAEHGQADGTDPAAGPRRQRSRRWQQFRPTKIARR